MLSGPVQHRVSSIRPHRLLTHCLVAHAACTELRIPAGTLTCNQMDFFKCSIAGVQYGHGVTEIQRTLACRAGLPAPVEPPEAADPGHQVPGFNFRDRCMTPACLYFH